MPDDTDFFPPGLYSGWWTTSLSWIEYECMASSIILSLGFHHEALHQREEIFRLSGLTVVSVTSPAQARFEIEMGRCGVFVSSTLVPDIVNADLFSLFRKSCPDGLAICVTNSKSLLPTSKTLAHVEIDESLGPEGILQIILDQMQKASEEGAA